jgi:O-antigen ligase
MGSFVVRLLPLILAISFLLRIPHRNFVNLFIIIISGILVLLSGERTAFLYYIFIILVYFYFNFNKKYFIYLIVLLFSFSVFTTAFNKKIIDRLFSHTLSQLTENNKFNYLSYRHTLHIETAYKMFLENKLLGHGLNSFRFLCSDKKYSVEDEIRNKNTFKSNLDGKFLIEKEKTATETRYNLYIIDKDNFKQRIFDVHELVFMGQAQYFYLFVKDGDAVTKDQKIFSYFEIGNGCNTHPHNIYLEFLSELGLIGFAFFFSIFLYTSFHLLKFIFRHYTKKIYDYEKSLVLCLASIFISMFPLLPSGSYFNSWLMFISYLPIGLYLSILKKND